MTDDLGDALRRLAADAPSDEGLLAGVHVASARAAVQRKARLASGLALALLLGGVGIVSAGNGAEPSGEHLVLDDPAPPTAEPTAAPDPTPRIEPTAERTSPGPLPQRTVPAGMYGGRAVSPAGEPLGGLFVYAIPDVRRGWTHGPGPVTRTREDGTFEVPCPIGPVLLNAFRLDRPQDGRAPNWMTTFVGGAHLLDQASTPSCTPGRHTTEVPPGVEVRGRLRGPASCDWERWSVQLEAARTDESDAAFGHVSRDQGDLHSRALADAEGRFRFAGLPPGHHWGFLAWAPWGWRVGYDIDSQHVAWPQKGSYEIAFDVSAEQCSPPPPTPSSDGTPSAEPGVSPSAEPEVTPTPEPEVT